MKATKAEGEYEIKSVAEKAGDYELHLWCDVEGNGQRQKVPGSPFMLNVVAAKASALGSLITLSPPLITGADFASQTPLTAGERLELMLHFRDDYGNACAPPDPRRAARQKLQDAQDALRVLELAGEDESPKRQSSRRSSVGGSSPQKSFRAGRFSKEDIQTQGRGVAPPEEKEAYVSAKLITPTDEEVVTDRLRPGDAVGSFSLMYEVTVAGVYEAHFLLGDKPLAGSPVKFRVKPAQPSGRLSTLQPPDTPPVIGILYDLLLVAEDKYGNKLDRGGAQVAARALGPSASPAQQIDNNDGTYFIRFTAGAVGEYRVEVRLDNVKIKGSPHLIQFTEPTEAQRRKLGVAASGAAGASTGKASEDIISDLDAEGENSGNESSGRESPGLDSGRDSLPSGFDSPASGRRGSLAGR